MNTRVKKIHFLLLIFLFLGLTYIFPVQLKAQENLPSSLLVSEIKLGGGNEPKEFISIFNQSDSAVDLSRFKIQYAKPLFNINNCQIAEWADFSYGYEVTLSGELASGHVKSITDMSLTDSLGGTVRIIDLNNKVHDLVAWDKIGASPSLAPCLDNIITRSTAPWPSAGKSIQRYVECDLSVPIDTNNNFNDFLVLDLPLPNILGVTKLSECNVPDDEEQGGGQGSGPGILSSCSGVIISEILVNPEGADADIEFIELYNPTASAISLKGCKLQTSSSSKFFIFDEIELKSKKYKAFYADQTLLSLINSSSGKVWLIDTDLSEIDEVSYEADIDDDVSWSLFDGGWALTYSITPNLANILISEKPCPTGQIRNSETNRCNNIVEEATLAACAPGKERNATTNRCRNISSLSTLLKSCSTGQYRNPETNRCKKAESSVSTLKPCKPNQERNPDTNRCRNVAGTLSSGKINDVKDVISNPNHSSINLIIAVMSLVGAGLYAIWEWRNELYMQLIALRQKIL